MEFESTAIQETDVAVLLSTYNGGKWIRQQMDSILNQKGIRSWIYIRDDGSSDNTLTIIKQYIQNGRVYLINPESRENLGAGDSFMELVRYAQVRLMDQFTYFAFADQDDIWLPEKLVCAVKQIAGCEEPCLYFSAKKIVDAKLEPTGCEDHICYLNPVLHCMGQSNAYGCTFVFNKRLLGFIQSKVKGRGYHDSWIFRLSVWCGFRIISDTDSYILYRQHDENVAGMVKKKIWYKQLFAMETWRNQRDRFLNRNLNDTVLMQQDIYNRYSSMFHNENMRILKLVVNYRYSFRDRCRLMRHCIFKTNGRRDRLKWLFRILTNRV